MMRTSQPTVYAVILNWNCVRDTLRCLASLYATEGFHNFDVVVVDNASANDSVRVLQAWYPDLEILKNRENLGYAGGNNVGLQHAFTQGADYVLLLNDDATVAPDALPALVAAAERHPSAGLLGPKLLSVDEPQWLLAAGGYFDPHWRPVHRGRGEMDHGQYDREESVTFLSGCALLISRPLVETVGLLDPRFFVYYEDVDWCYRAVQASFTPTYVPQARVWHPETAERDADSQLVSYYTNRNRLLFLAKHHLDQARLRALFTYGLWLTNWTLRGDQSRRRHRDALWYGLLDALRGDVGRSKRRLT